MWSIASPTTALKPTAIALGNFDGVHRGHQQVIQPIAGFQSLGHDLYSSVVTFFPHPQEVLTGQKKLLLTPPEEKAAYLHQMGIDQLVIVPFNQQIARLSPQEFVSQILVESLQAKMISVGEDFRFGHRRSGTVEDLKAIAAHWGIKAIVTPLENCQEGRISSSQIRLALSEGDLLQAKRLLGRPYQLQGKVIKGQQLGRTLGFPTANLELPEQKFLPRFGVYSVRVSNPLWTETQPVMGVMNLGNRPTVDGVKQTIEVHLFNWSGDLYDQVLCVELESFIRPEQKFASLDALKAQIKADCETALSVMGNG
ncbi:bifunctional riboflavin kinase/FAD synthetase [Roseofilum sp. BLCC_M91]|uniref:Riboflavin biosynthesis protein n=1 Tax=Roseofilum halophilum BLCC-M91 TaxID=3022259 RepID=A0ABT7BIW5_9CYAN|nr:bifunctional riboflavin kinase/FAD synthetase [Roseofilum halophilum]MDJ1179015.1 bifunctional riboflavin kinase/FAD synthetase [Roseofilum halophilum BLCC-M91]